MRTASQYLHICWQAFESFARDTWHAPACGGREWRVEFGGGGCVPRGAGAISGHRVFSFTVTRLIIDVRHLVEASDYRARIDELDDMIDRLQQSSLRCGLFLEGSGCAHECGNVGVVFGPSHTIRCNVCRLIINHRLAGGGTDVSRAHGAKNVLLSDKNAKFTAQHPQKVRRHCFNPRCAHAC